MKKLKRQLTFIDLFAISTGTMISSGFFLLPGIAAQEAGPGVVVAFFLAGLLTIPALLSKSELATAMPKAGGTYFFLDRSMGPLAGTIGGFGTWLALMFKGGFGLIGFGAYSVVLLNQFGINISMKSLVIGLCLILTVQNVLGTKGAGRLQMFMVTGVLSLLAIFAGIGLHRIHPDHFNPLMPHGMEALWSTVGLVFISYAGLTKIASVAEETHNPDRNIPLAMIVSLMVVMTVYTLGVTVMVGVLPYEELCQTLTPASDAARMVMGRTGFYLVAIAALLAFISCANAGLLSASRYPFAMARDRVLPHMFRRISARRVPRNAVFLTAGLIILFVLTFDVKQVAELAGAFQLLLFALLNLAVIVMRESRIEEYSPGFKSPAYPWVQLFGIFSSLAVISIMGIMEILFCIGVIMFGGFWYLFYASHRVERLGAWVHLLDRMAKRYQTNQDLIRELRGIQKEKGLKEGDPFEEMVLHAPLIDLEPHENFVNFFDRVGIHFHQMLGLDRDYLRDEFLLRNKIGETPAEKGVAIPHIRLENLECFHLVLGRSQKGLELPESSEPIHALFVLLGAKEHASVHIRILAELASRADKDGFIDCWLKAKTIQDLRYLLTVGPIPDDGILDS